MNGTNTFTGKVRDAINSSSDSACVADALVAIDIPASIDLGSSSQALAKILGMFRFDWTEFDGDGTDDYMEAEDNFVSTAVNKFNRILSDIESGKQYTSSFSVELVYSRLVKDEYSYKIISQNMPAESTDEARLEAQKIKVKAPRKHSLDNAYTLEDVRITNAYKDAAEQVIHEEYVTQT